MTARALTPDTKPQETLVTSKLAYSVPEAAAAIGVSPRLVWTFVKDNIISARRINNRTIIVESELRRYLDTLPPARKSAQS